MAATGDVRLPLVPLAAQNLNELDPIRALIDEALSYSRHAMICKIVALKITDTKTSVDVTPVFSEQVNDNGILRRVEYGVLEDVPVILQRGGGFVITVPLAVGDEGVLLFNDVCHDLWWQNGGAQVQDQWERRRHDINDGMFLPSPISCARAVTGYSRSSMQLRSEDGKTVLDIAQGQVMITANTVTVNAQNATVNAQQVAQVTGQSVKVTGSASVDIEGNGSTTVEKRNFLLHTHVMGGGATGPVI